MSNSFPSIPSDLALTYVWYEFVVPDNSGNNFPYTYTGGNANQLPINYGGMWSVDGTGSYPSQPNVQFVFDTPGAFGTFDQTAAEVVVTTVANDMCQLVADTAGLTLEEVQATATVNRIWYFSDTTGWSATYNDTMTYPPV